jgi:hypothetical protein
MSGIVTSKGNGKSSDIKREWKKVDKAFDKIMEIANKKDYFIS